MWARRLVQRMIDAESEAGTRADRETEGNAAVAAGAVAAAAEARGHGDGSNGVTTRHDAPASSLMQRGL
jgi:hypothetical protein